MAMLQASAVKRAIPAALGLAMVLSASWAAAEDVAPLVVGIDRAKVMRISRPADVVILGNPAIADATIQDNQTLIITGRSFGSTNLIVLDAAGQPIADEIVNVTATNDDVVTVYKRASRETLQLHARLLADADHRRPRRRLLLGQRADPDARHDYRGGRRQIAGRSG